jgi:hypothetical protein
MDMLTYQFELCPVQLLLRLFAKKHDFGTVYLQDKKYLLPLGYL